MNRLATAAVCYFVATLALFGAVAHAEDDCSSTGRTFTILNFSTLTAQELSGVDEAELWVDGFGLSIVRQCSDQRLLRQIKEGTEREQLLNRKIIMAIVPEGPRFKFYVIPEAAGGPLPVAPWAPVCGPSAKNAKRLKALLTAAIALYEVKKLGDDPCRDAERVTELLRRARAGLAQGGPDLGEKLLYDRLNSNDLMGRADARGCGPRDLNRRLLQTGASSPARVLSSNP